MYKYKPYGHTLIIVLAIILTGNIHSGIFDARSKVSLTTPFNKERKKSHILASNDSTTTRYVPIVMELNDATDLKDLEMLGCIIMRQRENFVIACVPEENIDDIEHWGNICAASCNTNMTLTDKAREFCFIDHVHQYNNTSGVFEGYSGKGVVTGFCDIGFDPGHASFRDRIGLMTDYRLTEGKRLLYDTPMDIYSVETDRDIETHATHVANIMAGSNIGTPYYGVAPKSTIVATTSDLYDASLLCGIEDIIEYAKSKSMPSVVNISVGSFTGPHDGSDIVSRYLELLSKETTICFSAGNFGDARIYYTYTFNDKERETIATFIENRYTWNGMELDGLCDFWSENENEFEVSVMVWDYVTAKPVYESSWLGQGDFTSIIDCDANEVLSNIYPKGKIALSGGINPQNGRYNIAVGYSLKATEMRPSTKWSRYYTALRVRGGKGVKIHAYCDGSNTIFHPSGIKDCISPDVKGHISNFCTAKGVISVGAFNSRNSVPVINEPDKIYNFNVPGVATWSSWGNVFNSQKLPHFCAPGNYLVSALSNAYYTKNEDTTVSYDYFSDGRHNMYYPQCGTSMASPTAAGIFALWLEADPTLSSKDLLDIATSTACSDFIDSDDIRWGAGLINARAGLEKVIKNASVTQMPDSNHFNITTNNGIITITIPGIENPQYHIYGITGAAYPPGASLSPGIYTVFIPGNNFKDGTSRTVKTAVK